MSAFSDILQKFTAGFILQEYEPKVVEIDSVFNLCEFLTVLAGKVRAEDIPLSDEIFYAIDRIREHEDDEDAAHVILSSFFLQPKRRR